MDGKKLIDTGKGIGALGAGLAVFGVGGVAASFGAIASSLSDGLLSFFGGKTPFQKIKEFGDLDINSGKVKENAEAFVAFSNAMTSYKGGPDTSIVETLRNNVITAMGENSNEAFVKFADFSNIRIRSADEVKKNAEAFVAFSNAMTSYKGSKIGRAHV